MHTEEVKTVGFYEVDSSIYDETRFVDNKGMKINRVQQAIVEDLCSNVKSKKVLELAVGTGRFTQAIVRRGADVVGVDSSISMLKNTLRKTSKFGKPSLIRADAKHLPLREGVFDYVLCINALNHIPNYSNVVVEASRVLKVKGDFVFNFPNTVSILLPLALFVNLRSKSVERPVFSKWYTASSVFHLLSSRQLRLVKIQGHIPIGFAQAFIDQLVRTSRLKFLAGVLFVKAEKL